MRNLRVQALFTVLLFLLQVPPCLGQPKSELKRPPPLDPAEGRKLARELVDNLLRIRPAENLTETLLFKVTDKNDTDSQFPVRFEILCTPTNFVNTYQTIRAEPSVPGMKLTIVHAQNQPNEYWVSQPVASPPRKLGTHELFLPFAASDFWIADLGLEFLHWPDQRVIRKEMRRYVFCQVLESTNPQPAPGGYAKVVSWIGANRPDELVLVHADAYDTKGKRLKQFAPKKLEKVNGVQELEEMQIWNRQAGTHTTIEFNLDDRRVDPAAGR